MKTYKFKTTINCSSCVAKVAPHLDANADIENWQVETTNPDKILSIETETMNPDAIKEGIERLGFKAEKLP